jgi:hypothetical protein
LAGTDLLTQNGYLIGKYAYKHILKTKGVSEFLIKADPKDIEKGKLIII